MGEKNFLVKLSVLDYFKYRSAEELAWFPYEEALCQFVNRKGNSRIIKNQTIVNLICLHSSKKEEYLELLFQSLAVTKDWRSIYRVVNDAMFMECLTYCREEIVGYVKKLAESNDYGKRVQELLERKCS
ncbi:hypothetical protein SAMN05421788_106219 [Filimonas lacunae]|uniref:DNA alkylation repair enzyme n=1 Tax=Filimonas lacunae TaxID=477680 RepID=A0A173MF75_9BACT|nr:hypothetical protein [Filimonas lacunae]BAV06157.1 hypothetical protein FLA_2173 [Filimonas lacunae]SIT24976.1 hypothetical protein SAMN05421788_106219 [Filimonas lacunae]